VAEPIVVNTGPLVSFARIGCLDLIGRLPYEFLSPAEVWQELDEGRAPGHPPGRTSLAQEEAWRPPASEQEGSPPRPTKSVSWAGGGAQVITWQALSA
jgi:hypothetical protein